MDREKERTEMKEIWKGEYQEQIWRERRTKVKSTIVCSFSYFAGHRRCRREVEKKSANPPPKEGKNNKPKKKKNRRIDLKEEERTKNFACVFLLLQVTVVVTIGRKGKRRRKLAKSTCFWALPVAAHEPTRCQWRRRVEQTRLHCSGDPKASQHYSCDLGFLALFMILVQPFFVNLNCLMCYLYCFEHWFFL